MGLFDRFKKKETPQTTFVNGVGRMPFPAYRGSEPYIFVSYAHVDSAKVFEEIKSFNENGYHVWYDEGISPGNEWTDEIAEALEKCGLFVVFFTPASVGSPNVQNEINYAIDAKKPFLAIHLQETTLRAGVKLQIGTRQAILKYNMSEEEYVYKYTSAFERMGMRQRKKAAAPASKPAACTPDLENREVPAQIKSRDVKKDLPVTGVPAEDDLSTVGDFQIEHGMLRDYLGSKPDIKLPDEVQIVGHASFGKGASVIETVDLNRTGALLNHAFEDCPNLREVRIPPSVTMIQEKPFVNCPRLTVYCRRDQLPEHFEEYYGGKEIVYLEDDKTETP